MKLSTLEGAESNSLAGWARVAADSGREVSLHVVGQGWELRCEGMRPFFFYPDRGLT